MNIKSNLKINTSLFLLLTSLFLFNTKGLAQETTSNNTNQETKIYNTSDLTEKPTYPGGMNEFYLFASQHYKLPKTPPTILLKGNIYLSLIVQKDGSITDFKILKDLGYGTGEEVIRVLKLSKKWIPGKLNNEIVAALYRLPFTIQSAD